jgi:F0F1-type ATP synthase assembly protein I
LKRKFFEKKKSKENHCPKIQKMKKKKKKKKEKKNVSVSVLKLRNFSWINCILLGVLVRLYLDDMALEANILLLLLLE